MEYLDQYLKYMLLIFGGSLSGFINVLAGGGSLVTLPILMGMGLSAPLANGTNRISILLQDISATIKFIKSEKLPVKWGLLLGIPTIIGALVGAFIASNLSEEGLNLIIFSLLILLMFYVYFEPPQKPVDSSKTTICPINLLTFFIFLLIGIYAGFIQAGATLIWFAALTWRLKLDAITADAIKIFLNLIMTPIALIIFIIHHQVAFTEGFLVGVGGFFGAWLGAKMAIRLSAQFIRISMLVILAVAAIYVLFDKIIPM